MNNVWVGTDWHLWSVNSVTDKRHQFRSISNLGRLSDAYAEDIQSDDIFIYLGDLCDPSVTDIKKLKAIVSSIPGYKVLCKGNHDTQDDTFYKEIGFDVVCEICVIHNLVFSHKPVRVPMGYLNIHGHLHTEKMSTLGYQHINAYDSNFFERPMLVDDLIDSAAFQSPEEYAGTDLKHVEEKFEKYTSVENDTYTQIVDLTDMIGLYPVDEAVELPTFKTPEELSKWMKSNIHYANFTKLKSSDGVVESKSGSCHDQVVFEYNALKNMGKKPKILFFIAYREGSNQGGMTHSLVYYSEGNKVKWFENSWSGMEGIHTYDSLSDLKADIKRLYSNMPDAKSFPELEFKSASISDFDTGINLGEFVSGIMDEAANDPLDEVLFSDITDVQYWENDDDAPKKKKVKQSPLDTDNQGVVAESANSQLLKLFFISSEEDLHETEMTPQIPKNYMTENGYEDNETPRISFSTSIDGCLMGLGKNVSNQVFYVYQPAGKYKVITPTIDQVPDVKITKERWICEPVKLVRVGKIRAIDENGPHDDGIPYTYGKNGEHEARLYHWGWKWIKQFKYDLNESATMNTFPFIFLSQENMNDELYPEGKMLLRNMDDAVQELYLYQRPAGEYYVHNTEPGYYRIIMSPEFSAGYFSTDTINLSAVGKIKVNSDYSWEWIEQYGSDMNEAKGLGSRVYQLVNLDKTMTESSSYVTKSKFNGYTETIYHLDEFRKAYQRSGKTSSGIPDDIDTVSTFFEDILDNYNQIAPETLDRDKIAACKSADDLIDLFYARANTFGNDLTDEYTSSIEMLHHLINLKTNPANKARFDEIVPMNLSKDEFAAFINKRIDEMDNIEAFVVAALKSNLQMYGIIRREIQYLEESSTNKEHIKALKEYMNKHEDEFIHIRTKNGVCTYEYDFSAFGRGKVYVDNHIYEQSHDLVKPSRLLIRATLYDYIVYSHGIDSSGQYTINDVIIDNRVFRNVADIVTYLQKGTPKRILIMACNNSQVVYDSNDLRFANVKYPSREMIMEAAATDTVSDPTKLLKVWKSQIDNQLRNANRVHRRVVKLISDDDFVLYPKECSLIFAKTSSKSGKLVYQEKFKVEDRNTFINTTLASIDSLIKLYERTCFVCKMMINIINDAYKGILIEAGYGWEIKPVTGLSWAPYDYRFGYQYHTQQECFNDLALCHELFYESSCDHYQGRVFSADNPNYWRFTEKNLKPAILDRYNKSQLNEMYLNSLSAAVEDTTELHEMSPKDKQAIANKYGLRTPGEYQQDGQDNTQERVNQRREKQLKDLKKARKIKKRKAFVRKVKSHLPGAQNESAMGILSMPKVVSSPPFDIDDKVDLYVGLANKKINEYGKTAKNIPVPKRKFKKNPNKNRAVPDYYLKLWFNPDRASNLLINDAAPSQHTIWLYPDEYCTLMFVCADDVCQVYMLDSYIAGDYHQFLGSFQVDMGIGARLKAALKEDSSGVDDSESDHYEADATDRDPLWGDRNHFFKHPNAMDQDYDKTIQESSSTKIAGSNLTVRKTDTTNPNDSVSSKAVKLNFYDGKDRVGTAGVSGYDTRKGFLYDLEVMKKYRGKGYGKRILDYVIKNYSVTDLSVAADNDVAINMYKKAGFRIKKTFDSNGENGYEKGKFHWMQRGSGGSLSESFASRDPDIDTSITENYKVKLINPTMFMDSINEDSGGDNSTFNKIKAFNMSLTYNFRYGLRINGIYDPDRNTTADDWDRYYQYQRPHDFNKSKVGTCWDYVGYESWYFSRNFQNVQYNTYCIIFRDGITDPSHTFLIFQLNGNYYYFESSFKKNAGIYVGQNENELIEHVISMMVEHYPSPGVNPEEVIRSGKCKVYQYNANDPRFYKIKGAEQYLSFIEKHGEEVSIQYKPNKKSDVVLVHSGTLYHGSLNKHSILKPRSKIDGKNLLFASPRYEFALAYAGRQWNDLDINQSVVNDQLILVEIYPGAFKDIFQTSGYIYEVPDDTFQKVSSSEYISEVDVVPTKTRRVQNVLVELEKSNVQLYYYPDLPPYMPSRYEYVKARCDQYGIDFKKIQNDLYRKGATDIIAPIQETYKFELVDKNLRFADRLDEAATKNQKLYPVYVVLVHSGTGVSKAIKAISHSEYSHASICFDSSLDKMYSFARKDPRNPFIGGFRYESIGKGFYEQKEIPYAVYVVPCTESQVKKMKKRLNYFIQNQEKFTFDFTGLVTNYLGIVNNPAHRWFCSRFVADVLNAGAPKNNPYVAEPSLQDPDDFKDTDWAIYVDSGENLMKYDRKKVDRKTNQIIRKEILRRMTVNESAIFDLDAFNPFIESTLNYQFAMMDEAVVDDFVRYLKSFKVKFDKEGNVIISRREVDQLDKHFRQSLRMIKAYENAGDLDSVKLELCKINYMIELINEYYLSPKAMKSKRVKADLRKEMLDLRSVMLNAFSQHLKYVKTMDPAFNFKSYYDTSIYGKNIEIPKPVLSAIGKAIVTQL